MRKIVGIIKILLLIAYFPAVMAFVSDEKSNRLCVGFDAVNYSDDDKALIPEKNLQELVRNRLPKMDGVLLSQINTHDLESIIEKHPVVKKCEIFTTPGGLLHVGIKQREPLLRVFNQGTSYYLDNEGVRVPVSLSHSAYVPVVSGNVNALKSQSDLLTLINFIGDSKFWNAQVEQIHVNSLGEFVLVPRVGDHLIFIGDLSDLDDKFARLKALYRNGWTLHEWNIYKSVSLKYKGQIVCTKK